MRISARVYLIAGDDRTWTVSIVGMYAKDAHVDGMGEVEGALISRDR